MVYADEGNSRKQGGKEKERLHGYETSKSRDMFAMSFHQLEGGISKREDSGFWARGEDNRDETREWLSWAVHEYCMNPSDSPKPMRMTRGTPGSFMRRQLEVGVRNSRSQL